MTSNLCITRATLSGHAKFMGYMGPVQMGYWARTFSTHVNNGGGTFFRKHIYTGQIAHSFLQPVSNQSHVIILSLPMLFYVMLCY